MIRKTVDVACDFCLNWIGNGFTTTNKTRKYAKEKGWKYFKNIKSDMCPKCYIETHKQEENYE